MKNVKKVTLELFVDESVLSKKGYELSGYYERKIREMHQDLGDSDGVLRHACLKIEDVKSDVCVKNIENNN